MAIVIHRAVYGEKDGAHDLLCSSLPRDQLPSALRGLADRPPGTLPPGIEWSPLLACAPVGNFWVVWRSIEDSGASRGGMVQSHCLLISQAYVAEVPELGPLLATLPCAVVLEPKATPFELTLPSEKPQPLSEPLTPQLANLLTDPGRTQPIVYSGNGTDFERLLLTLWRAFGPWPELRQRLTCLPAFEPGTLTQPNKALIVLSPEGLNSRWAGHPLVDQQKAPESPARPAADLLLGTIKPEVLAFRQHFARLPGEFAILDKLAYGAASWDAIVRGAAEPLDFSNVLRIVGLLAPELHEATSLKAHLVQRVVEASWNDVLARSMANLDLTPFGEQAGQIAKQLRDWVGDTLSRLAEQEAYKLLARAVQQRCATWWEQALRDGVTRALSQHSPGLFSNIWRWWSSESRLLPWIFSCLPSTQQMEKALADSCPEHLDPVLAEKVAELAIERDWFLLHAAVLARVLPPEELVRRQCGLSGGPGHGLAVVVARCPPSVLLKETLRNPIPALIAEVGRLAAAQRSLLKAIDPRIDAYRQIWLLALRRGTDAWTEIQDPKEVLFALMDMLLEGRSVEEDLLRQVAASPASRLVHYPRRAEIWTRLPGECRESFLQNTASDWLEGFAQGLATEPPEETLRKVVVPLAVRRWASTPVSVELMLSFASLFPEVQESELLPCLSRAIDVGSLSPQTAGALGRLCVQRKWRDIVKMVSSRRSWRRTDLDIVIREGSSLLTFWERPMLSIFSRPEQSAPTTEMWDAFQEVASDLYGKGPQESDLWERAGGKNKKLPEGADGATRWRAAIRLIKDGAGPPGGLASLIDAMLEDFPHNPKLLHLRQLVGAAPT